MNHFCSNLKLYLLITLAFFAFGCSEDDDNGSGLGTRNGYNYSRGPGQSAQDFVSDKVFDALTIEILFQEKARPSTTALDNLEAFLEQFLSKDAISLVLTTLPDTSFGPLTSNNLREIENEHRTIFNRDKTLSACLIFVDSEFANNPDNGSVLGIAYNNTSMAIFGRSIRNNTGGLFQPSTASVESAVANHEFGHIMGLVNNGAPLSSDHHDEENGAHCDVEDCLMFFAVDGSDFISNISGGNIPTLDPQCQADLEALK